MWWIQLSMKMNLIMKWFKFFFIQTHFFIIIMIIIIESVMYALHKDDCLDKTYMDKVIWMSSKLYSIIPSMNSVIQYDYFRKIITNLAIRFCHIAKMGEYYSSMLVAMFTMRWQLNHPHNNVFEIFFFDNFRNW